VVDDESHYGQSFQSLSYRTTNKKLLSPFVSRFGKSGEACPGVKKIHDEQGDARMKIEIAAMVFVALICTGVTWNAAAQINRAPLAVTMPSYSVTVVDGEVPELLLRHDGQPVFQVPITSELTTPTAEEHLSKISYSLERANPEEYVLKVNATSSLWGKRWFVWRFFEDRLEFQQFATGHGKLGRCYFLSNGVSGPWSNGSSPGFKWNAEMDADRYFSPAPNHANQTDFSIAIPQTLGFHVHEQDDLNGGSEPEQINGIFSPPPLFLAFHELDGEWTGIGIGARPGEYQFPALEYTGSRYAGASFYVDYMGYRNVDGEYASPVLSVNFGWSALGVLEKYTAWMMRNGFGTKPAEHDVYWHHLPIFCGWAEQTAEAFVQSGKASTLSTQANYEQWITELESRGLPIGTIVIDDKWQKEYGTFDVDTQKWPDLKGFVAQQHAKGRHVLLWVPVAQSEGLAQALCVQYNGRCVIADVGNPAYEAMLRQKVKYLVHDVGIDGFKEDWVGVPSAPGLKLTGDISGIEFVRRFQEILYSETHKWKPQAMVETQTPNVLFLNSSDVIRLNDIYAASRNVAEMMRDRARIAHISGWPLVDTDNASATTLSEWWNYMQQQPMIGIPSLYFVSRTVLTQETPTKEQWAYLATIWKEYIHLLEPVISAP
jgi:Glycosyl hydrolases family 31